MVEYIPKKAINLKYYIREINTIGNTGKYLSLVWTYSLGRKKILRHIDFKSFNEIIKIIKNRNKI